MQNFKIQKHSKQQTIIYIKKQKRLKNRKNSTKTAYSIKHHRSQSEKIYRNHAVHSTLDGEREQARP
jgi:hypothetical protein